MAQLLSKRAVIAAVQVVAAIFRTLFGRACRYQPSCSAYAAVTLERFPLWKALGLLALRILRCHPFSAGGYDPPPIGEARPLGGPPPKD